MPATEFSSVADVPIGVAVVLRDLVHTRIGVFFDQSRLTSLLEKVQPLAARLDRSLMEYYYLLKDGENSPEEWARVMDALSVQETYFWREHSQIDALVRRIVPRWFAVEERPLRIWSAACASGEEPLSLAIALQEAGFGPYPIQIIGSDASEAALQKCRTGIYRERAFRALPPSLKDKYFRSTPGGARVVPELAARVAWRQANLVEPSEMADLARSPVVFCRNVFIYFSPEGIRRTLSVLTDQMPDGGHLCVGASESLLSLTTAFDLQEIGDAFVYVRKPRS